MHACLYSHAILNNSDISVQSCTISNTTNILLCSPRESLNMLEVALELLVLSKLKMLVSRRNVEESMRCDY